MNRAIRRALLSVSDKTHITVLASFLAERDVEIIATGGTAGLIAEQGLAVTPVEEITGNPEAFGGRMKTISFQIESSILFRRDRQCDVDDAEKLGLRAIDLVVCNLYPFEKIAGGNPAPDCDTLVENIDIGGPTMIRAAAKNYRFVTVLTDPAQYEQFMKLTGSGTLNEDIRFNFALQALRLTARYDQFIFNTLAARARNDAPPLPFPLAFHELKKLRYGENPHQRAWMAPWDNSHSPIRLARAEVLQGKELSYNNMTDADSAWKCTSELHYHFPEHFAVTIVKHGNPCGAAVGRNALSVLEKAWDCDPVSSFGSIISFSWEIGRAEADWLAERFVEVIVAPACSPEALEIFARKKNLRLLLCENRSADSAEKVIRSMSGALLIQDEDEPRDYEFKSVTTRRFPKELRRLCLFGMVVNKYLRSNSIVLVDKIAPVDKIAQGSTAAAEGMNARGDEDAGGDEQVRGDEADFMVIAGAGMGQPNRLDSLKLLAAERAGLRQRASAEPSASAEPIPSSPSPDRNSGRSSMVLISDAFFPFRDSIDMAHSFGIQCIVQPGGSIRDKEVINACNEHSIAMCFTSVRHFRH